MLKQQIFKLRAQGKSYRQISIMLNCAKSLVCYHCSPGQKEKTAKRRNKYRYKHPYQAKLERFKNEHYKTDNRKLNTKTRKALTTKALDFQKRGIKMMNKFTIEDVINKFGATPKCYLTGQDIDINKTRAYHFDHIIPISKGGDNTLNNLGICTKEANMMKSDATPDELLARCKQILENFGYTVTK